MTRRRPCPVAPGPLEEYAARFDDLFGRLAQRRGFREYLAGLLAPRERNKTLTALAGAEPVSGAQHPAVQRLQFFLSESRWDPEQVNARRLELLAADPATTPHGGGVLVIDDSGDRKDGTKTAHVGRQWLGRYGKTGNGVVTVTTVWAGERVYYPVHAVPYTPARHFAKGKNDPAFRTKLAIGAELAVRARAAGFCFRAVVADSAYGDQDGFRGELADAGLPFVMALKPRRGTWAYGPDAHTPVDAARDLAWDGPGGPGDWRPVTRAFRDGHAETWWAADATLGWWGPDGARRLVVATADPPRVTAAPTPADEGVIEPEIVNVGGGATTRVIDVERVSEPLVPVIVTVELPAGVLAVVVTDSVVLPAPETLAGANEAVAPAGTPLAPKLTIAEKPFSAPTVTV